MAAERGKMAEITHELLHEVPKSIPRDVALPRDAAGGFCEIEAREEVIAVSRPRHAIGQDMNTIYGMHAGRDARLARIERRLGLVGIH
jgi:hypothetical protein